MNSRNTFRALSSRNYRLFTIGQGLSLIGTWAQRTALSWLIYRLTDSAALLGVVAFCGQIPSFFIAPFAGVLVDRVNKHRLIILTQSLSMVQASALGILLMTGTIRVWHILALSMFIGLVNAFDMPARQSFVVDMVDDKSMLGNAIALNSSMVNVAQIIGPSVAGLLIAAMGETVCFFINSASYGAVILSLLLMRRVRMGACCRENSVVKSFREGCSYVFGTPQLRAVILLLGLVSLTGVPYLVLMPIFARDVLLGGPRTLGFLMGGSGLGALCGALFLAFRKGEAGLERVVALSAVLFGGSLVSFAVSRILWLSMAMVFLAGVGMMVQMAASNTILQTVADDDKRGRVMSFFIMAFFGMAPFGSLLAGEMAGHFGASNTLLVGGFFCIAGAAVFAGSQRLSLLKTSTA